MWNSTTNACVLLAFIGTLTAAHADDLAPAATPQAKDPNQVSDVVKEAGKPVQIHFNDGRTIQFKILETFAPFHTKATLSDNSCTRNIGLQATYLVPVITRSLVPYWSSHPTKAGQPVVKIDSDDKKAKIAGQTAYYARNNTKDFDSLFAHAGLQVQDQAALQSARANSEALGWLECAKECKDVLPAAAQILFWDENFETNNEQLEMVAGNRSPSINQMTSRMEQMPIHQEGRKIYFSVAQRAYGAFGRLFPPGITYQVQWNFQAENIVNPEDSMCQMAWDLDFTQIFTQFTKLTIENQSADAVKISELPEYLYVEEDGANLYLSYLFTTSNWESSAVQK